MDAQAIRDEKVKVLRAIQPLGQGRVQPAQRLAGWRRRGIRDVDVCSTSVQRLRSRAVRRRHVRRPADQGISPGGGRRSGVEHRDIRRRAAVRRHLAMVGRAVLSAYRQAAAQAADRDRHPVPPAADGHVRRGRGHRPTSATNSSSASSRTRASRCRSQAKMPGMRMRLQPVKMDFRYGSTFGERPAGGLRAAAAGRDARRRDAVHPGRRGGLLVAIVHADAGGMGAQGRGRDSRTTSRDLGPAAGRFAVRRCRTPRGGGC